MTDVKQSALQFDVVKNVTKEFFVIAEDGTPSYFKFDSAFVVDETIQVRTRKSKNDPDGTKKEPMEIADVTNIETGEVGRLIGNSVIKSELRRTYPDNKYVGLMFEIKQGAGKTGSTSGNKYRTFKIVEIRLKGNAATPKK
jgi:hypothetical protein